MTRCCVISLWRAPRRGITCTDMKPVSFRSQARGWSQTEVSRGLDDFVKVEIGLLIAPTVVNDISHGKGMGLYALLPLFRHALRVSIERSREALYALAALFFAAELIMPIGLGTLAAVSDGIKPSVLCIGVDDALGVFYGGGVLRD